MRTTRSRALALAIGAAALTLLVSGCGSGDAPTVAAPSASSSYGPAASGPHNDADVAFATDMVPHHAQAVEMADLALKQATDARVKDLATAIKAAQDPEIRTMSGWLAGWGEQVPAASGAMDHGHGHSAAGMGMMSADQMAELASATGSAFDKLWVAMMTEHHEGAVTMAKTELADGQNAEAKQLAEAIIAAQTREIATMDKLAATLA